MQQPANGRLIPAYKWNDYHDWPTTGGLRRLILRSNLNGMEIAIRRVGRRILINEQAFFAWVERVGGQR